MTNTLIIIAHDNIETSKINKFLLEHVKNTPDTTTHVLQKDFDIQTEQELLLAHDHIILQFPVQWFSTPVVLKKWIDQVLSWGFAYGDNFKLENKTIRFAVSTGGTLEAYQKTGQNGHTLEEFLLPLIATAKYVKLNVLPIFSVNNVFNISDEELLIKVDEYKKLLA